jgi:hypothetical protein
MYGRPEISGKLVSTAPLGGSPGWLSPAQSFANGVDQFGYRHPEAIRQFREHINLDPDAAHFVVANGPLRETERVSELLLSQFLFAPQLRDPVTQRPVEGFLVGNHRNPSCPETKP